MKELLVEKSKIKNNLKIINNIINKAIFSDFVKKVNKLLIIIDSITVNATINDKYCLTFVLLFGDTLFFIFNSLYKSSIPLSIK